MVRLRAADGPRPRAPRHALLRDPRGPLARASASRSAGWRWSASASRSSSPTRRTPARSGRRASSGSRCPGAPTRTARWASASYYESPYRPGEKITLEEYYRWMFENSVPGLPEKAAAEGLDPLGYMRRYGAVEVSRRRLRPARGRGRRARRHRRSTAPRTPSPSACSTARTCRSPAARTRSPTMVDGVPRQGFNTPSRKLELYSETLAEWGWPRAGHARLRPQPRPPLADRSRGGRVRAAADLPAADDDPLALGQRQVPQRALAHAPAARLPRGRRAHRAGHRRARARGDRDRLVRDQGAGHRGDPARASSPPRTTWAAGG